MLNIPTFHRVALLIDADNIQLSHIEEILKISGYYGKLEISRAYGDWKQPPLSASYDDVCNLDIECIQVDRVGKDTTDKQLMIEAGEILGEDAADVFIIASGDGDFSLLCKRIKQRGRKVVGIGNKGQTSTHLQASCDTFYHLEEALIQLEQTRLEDFKALLVHALDSILGDEDGWVNCGSLGKKLRELDCGFEKRFGCKKLSKWLKDLGSQLERGQMVRRPSTNL